MDDASRAILARNLAAVRARIAAAAQSTGRRPEEITLVAVTKSVGAEVMQALTELGVADLAENRLQTAEAKFPSIAGLQGALRPRLHFIGHLQRNKVRGVLERFDVIHSVDSLRLAEEIEKRAEQLGRGKAEVFLEINVSGEASKQGLAPPEFPSLLEGLRPLRRVRPVGLMTMAPLEADEAETSRVFSGLAALLAEVRASGHAPESLSALSMGMSGDFEIAIRCGATHVRVGSALFEGLD